MSFAPKSIYAPCPATERGKPIQLGKDPKGKKFVYCSGNNVVIRDLADPLDTDVYQEHQAATSVAKYAPSGFYIASGDANGIVRIWDTVNKEHVLKFEMPALGGRVADLDWTEDSKRIVCVGEGREFYGRAFFMDTGASVGEISGHSKNLISCSIKQNRPYRLATCGEDFETCHFNGVPFKWVKTVDSDSKRFVNCVRFAPDGKRYVTASSDKLIQIYDGKEGTKSGALPVEHKGGIYSVAWNDAGDKLLSASGDKTCKTWDMNTLQCISTFTFGTQTHDQQYGCLWSGDYLLSVSLSGDINYLDEANPSKPKRILHGHQKFVTALAYDSSSSTFYTGSYDADITKWDEQTAETYSFSGTGHKSQINGLATDGSNIISGSMDSSVRVTDAKSLEYSTSFGTDVDTVGVVAGSAGLVVAVSLDSIIRISSGGNASDQVKKQKLDYTATCVSLSSDQKHIAVGGDDRKVRIYGIEGDSFNEVKVLEGHKGKLNDSAWSPDGTYLATVCHGREFIVWNVADWSIKTKAWGSFHDASINSVAFAPDSIHLATGSLDQNIIVWTIGKRTKRTKITGAHKGGVNKVLWTTDTNLASVGQDNMLKTWTITHE